MYNNQTDKYIIIYLIKEKELISWSLCINEIKDYKIPLSRLTISLQVVVLPYNSKVLYDIITIMSYSINQVWTTLAQMFVFYIH